MTSPAGQSRLNQKTWQHFLPDRFKFLLCLCALMATFTKAAGQSNLDTTYPLGFFTNVASHLLSARMNIDLSHFQIYPTNQYTPAVHRLLQLAANIYEATSTNSYPSVFRPIFVNDGTNICITGYEQVTSITNTADPQLALPVNITSLPVGISTNMNVYGIPWIIGARKGFPNFNEFAVESAFQLTRRLQVTRPNTNSPISSYQYNQKFLLSLTNQLGVECWNSYANDFTNPVTIYVTDDQTVSLTNDEGFNTNFAMIASGSLLVPNGTNSAWPGYTPMVDPFRALASFQIPLNTSAVFLPLSIYRFNAGGSPYLTSNLALPFETNVVINGTGYPEPHWWLTTSNNLQVVIMDTAVSPYRIIDYVQLSGPNSSRDLSSEIISNYDIPPSPSGNDLWDTNFVNGVPIPIGLISQIGVSLGNYASALGGGTWGTTSETIRENEIDGFRAFYHYSPIYPNNSGDAQAVAQAQATNAMLAPYIPIATVVQHFSWQANDPLVHYLASDLNWAGANLLNRNVDNLTNENLGFLNVHYMPWGGNPLLPTIDQNPYNLTLKDPLVRHSDDWDFPTNESLSGSWLGRVHRGTPWQTIYLKTSDILQQIQVNGGVTNYIGTNTWMTWTGDTDAADAVAMAPVQDWHLASLLAFLMNTNDLQSLFSVNNPNPTAWLNLFNGLTAMTNDLSDAQIASGIAPGFDSLVISSNSSQASFLVNTIRSAQAGQSGGYFHDVGDILAIFQLTQQSPYLNWNDSVQQQGGISDAAYEIIPGQLLPLLRADSVGSLVSTNGQITAQFSGYDNHTYAVEASSNLVDWARISTNRSVNGGFGFTNVTPANASRQFYRSVLLQ